MMYRWLICKLCLSIDMLVWQIDIVVQIAGSDPGFWHMHSIIVLLFLLHVAHTPQHAVLPCLSIYLLVYQSLLM